MDTIVTIHFVHYNVISCACAIHTTGFHQGNYLHRRLASGEGIVSLGVRHTVVLHVCVGVRPPSCDCIRVALVLAANVIRYIQA